MAELVSSHYLSFPFRIDPKRGAPAVARRSDHIREEILQVLLTNPGERVFRPEFGAGLRALVHEPNSSGLWEVTRKRLIASLVEALRGEVDPKTLDVIVAPGEDESHLRISIRYQLTTLGYLETHELSLQG